MPASLFGIPVGLLGLAGAWHDAARIWNVPPGGADAIGVAGLPAALRSAIGIQLAPPTAWVAPTLFVGANVVIGYLALSSLRLLGRRRPVPIRSA